MRLAEQVERDKTEREREMKELEKKRLAVETECIQWRQTA